MAARALFLDRDGTLMVDTGYVRDPANVVLLPGVAAGLAEARALGFELVVISNQSGIARGLIREDELLAVEARFEALLAEAGVTLDLVLFCRHGPDEGCACRKPAPGLLRDAARARSIDLTRSVMVGDRVTDVAAGRAVGSTTVLIGASPGGAEADYTVPSFSDVPPILRRLVRTHA